MRNMSRYTLMVAMLLLGSALGGVPHLSHAATSTPALTAPGVLTYTNAERKARGLPALTSNPTLSKVAATKMADLFAREYFAHEAPTGEDVSDLAKGAGYDYLTIGENLALGDFTSSKHVVQAWMDSPGHKANILSRAYSEIGIAAGKSMYKGRVQWIVVQSFGLPRAACPKVDPVLRANIDRATKTLTLLQTMANIREKAYKAERPSEPGFRALIDAYNKAATLYNERATEYRTLVERYNKQIDASNACIKKKTKK
jgi:hypothetical protein